MNALTFGFGLGTFVGALLARRSQAAQNARMKDGLRDLARAIAAALITD